jgi:hypothetical protein
MCLQESTQCDVLWLTGCVALAVRKRASRNSRRIGIQGAVRFPEADLWLGITSAAWREICRGMPVTDARASPIPCEAPQDSADLTS